MWDGSGKILKGYLKCYDGKILKFKNKDLIRKGTLNSFSKIIYYKKGTIYEGGLRKNSYENQGFVYSNYLHPFYYETNCKKGKFNGRYMYHSFYYGFETEEYYKEGKEFGSWKYKTVKGYEYIGDTATKRQKVFFPFLNKDFFTGDMSIWCD